ncbi:MAG: iron-sulfur cluster assembly scaffold protein [Candidatus Falkowbacteria bacterium]|nr:MAG: iron-sulfur cluster assembly scaffold protein [Candidatus Falkowbacteria bacterium]
MDIYAQNIIDHYKHPRNFGVLSGADFKQQELNATCGDDITVFLKFSGTKLKTLNFIGQGCAISQAGISILSEELIGKTKKQILAYNFEDIKNIFGVEISARRYNCAMLGLRAVQKAISDLARSK